MAKGEPPAPLSMKRRSERLNLACEQAHFVGCEFGSSARAAANS